LGKASLLDGNLDLAAVSLRKAISLKPQDPSPHYQLSRVFERQGKTEDAKLERQRFLEIKKSQPETGGMATGRVQ